MDRYMHEYFSLQRFRAAYERNIEPLMADRSQWPKVELGFVLHAPLPKRSAGRSRKLRLKSCLEKGGSSGQKKRVKKQVQLGSKNRCKECGELGHRQSTCPTNGVKKRKRKSKNRNVETEIGEQCTNEAQGSPVNDSITQSSPVHNSITQGSPVQPLTPLEVLQASPGPVTRRQLALAMASEPPVSPPRPVVKAPKKITPRKIAI